MGVSLERVQNKFACIIGELCNEPVVLSQFAIWLDMRLAEYKAKGSICLECCGDIPKPTWLKGLPLKETLEALPLEGGWPPGMLLDDTGQGGYEDDGLGRRIDPNGHTRRRSAHHSSRQFHPSSRRSDNGTPTSSHPTSPRTDLDLPSDIIIKQEALDPSDNMQSSSHLSDWRKRPSDRDYDPAFPSHLKSQRLSSEVSPLNEPLTAIINRDESTDSKPNFAIDKLSAMTDQSFNQSINDDDDDDDIQVEIISGPSSILPSSSSNLNPYPGSSSADFSSSLAANSSDLDSSRLSQNDSLLGSDLANSSVSHSRSSWESTDVSRAQILNASYGPGLDASRADWRDETPVLYSTVRMNVTALNIFNRWMLQEMNDQRSIQAIQPIELDPILANFFTTVRMKSGREYSAKSLKAFREGLERHLRSNGYPVSITTSAAFTMSQKAYKIRYSALKLTDNQKRVHNDKLLNE